MSDHTNKNSHPPTTSLGKREGEAFGEPGTDSSLFKTRLPDGQGGERGEFFRSLVILLLLSAALYLLKLGSFSLYDAAETTYGEFVKNMLRSGNWLTFYYNGAIIFDKPPLYYWFVGLFSLIFGFNEWSMRLPAALSGIATVALTYLLGKRFYGEQAGWLSALVVMTALQFLVQSRIAELDIMLTLTTLLSLYWFYTGYQSGEKKYYLLSYIPMGLAMLIKGLLGVALPGGAIFLFLFFKGELKKLGEIKPILGILIVLALGTPWYIIEYLRHGKVFLEFALGFLFLSRFGNVIANHTGPWYYYFPAILLGFAPWSAFLLPALWQTFKNWRRDPELLSLCLILPTLLVFSIAKTKLPSYLLPLYPMFALMVGKLWHDFLEEPKSRFAGMLTANILLAVIAFLLMLAAVIAGSSYSGPYQESLPLLYLLAAILTGGTLLSIGLFLAKKYRAAFASLVVMVFIIAAQLTLQILPKVEDYKGAKDLGASLPHQALVAAFNVGNRPSIVLHSPTPVTFLTSEAEITPILKKGGYIFTTVEEYEKIKLHSTKNAQVRKKGDLVIIYEQP